MTGPEPAGARRIREAILDARDAGRPALAPFVTAGFPERSGFGALLDAIAAEAELVEVGVPFSDPMADGVTIQRASRRALEAGVTLAWILDVVGSRRSTGPIILMSYLNPILALGLERFAARAADARVSGLIVPDLPLEECAALGAGLERAGLALVQLVTPVTPQQRLERIGRATRGFVYAVTRTGTTGGGIDDLEATAGFLARVRAATEAPVLAGFGIRVPRDLERLAPHVDGVIVGSALIEALERGADPVTFLRALRGDPAGERRQP